MRWPSPSAATAVAAITAITACASDGPTGAPRDARSTDAAATVKVKDLRLAGQISGWTEEADSYVTFDASSLYTLINGGAQPHVDRGLMLGSYQIMTSDAGRRVEVLAEDFGSAAKAQGMYAYAKGLVGDALSLPNYPAAATGDVVLGGALFHVVFQRFYFKLTFTGYSDAERQSLLSDAESFVAEYERLITTPN